MVLMLFTTIVLKEKTAEETHLVWNFGSVMKSNSCKNLTSYVVFESFDC